MPSIKGPSITCRASLYFWNASSVSSSMNSVIPLIKLWLNRSSTLVKRQAWVSSTFSSFLPLNWSANVTNRSVASSLRFIKTSSTCSRRSFGISSYTSTIPAFTMPISRPALIAWYKNAECIASLTRSFPRKEKLILDTPPDTLAPGRFCLIQRVALIKSTA